MQGLMCTIGTPKEASGNTFLDIKWKQDGANGDCCQQSLNLVWEDERKWCDAEIAT